MILYAPKNDSIKAIMTELYHQPNEQKGGKGAVPVTNIDFSSRKSSLPTGSIIILTKDLKYRFANKVFNLGLICLGLTSYFHEHIPLFSSNFAHF